MICCMFSLDIRVSIRSEGCNDPGKHAPCGEAFIKVDSVDYAAKKRGYNFVVVDAYTGKVLYIWQSSQSYNLHSLNLQ